MASSGLSSVIGRPFSAGSALGFLSFAAAGMAALAGNSRVSEKTQAKESTAARNDRGVVETAGNLRKKVDTGRAGGLIALSLLPGSILGKLRVTNRITLDWRRSCGSPEAVSNPYQMREEQEKGKVKSATLKKPRVGRPKRLRVPPGPPVQRVGHPIESQ